MKILKDKIESEDKYFKNSLSKEYEFFMNYLIRRAEESSVATNSEDSTTECLDDQKDLILRSISSSIEHFQIFELEPFDIETLLEVLCDLLNCLPTALIPKRFFIYIDDNALLVSETFTNSTKKCFSFLYLSYGRDIVTLRIYATNSNINNKTVLWELKGSQSVDSKNWKQAKIPIDNLNNEYSIVIEGIIGRSYESDVA